jgi:hypothetical protein
VGKRKISTVVVGKPEANPHERGVADPPNGNGFAGAGAEGTVGCSAGRLEDLVLLFLNRCAVDQKSYRPEDQVG